MTRRAGFTFVELLVSITIVGLLSTVAVPRYRTMKRQALATQVLGDFQVVRVAALSFYSDSGYFPPDAGAGQVPRNLGRYLPFGFAFERPEWSIDYEYLPASPGSPRGRSGRSSPATPELVGVAAATLDDQLGTTVMAMLGNNATILINGRLTLFISGM